MQLHLLDLRKRRFEDIIRTERPDTIVHYAFVRHFRGDPETRHEVNVLGTRRMLEYAAEYGVKRVIVLSSGYVYGALPENPNFLDEEQPLNVSRDANGRLTLVLLSTLLILRPEAQANYMSLPYDQRG